MEHQGTEWLLEAEDNTYSARMTGNPFLFPETRVLLAACHQGISDDSLVQHILDTNAFQYRSSKSISKRVRGLLVRYTPVPLDIRTFISEAPASEARKIALLVLAVRDRLLREFLEDVVVEKMRFPDPQVTFLDFKKFFLRKAEVDDDVANWTDGALNKLRSVYTGTLTDVGIFSNLRERMVRPVILEPETRELVIHRFTPKYLRFLEGT